LPRESLMAFVLSETYDRFPGDVADSLGLHLQALVRGSAVERGDLEILGLRLLQLEVREGFQLLEEGAGVRIDEIIDAQYDGTFTFLLMAEGLSWVEIDELDVRQSIRGQTAEGAEEYLARHLSLAADPIVEVSPDWWGRVPWLPFRIDVQVLSQGDAAD
jgi:hypothetical protein